MPKGFEDQVSTEPDIKHTKEKELASDDSRFHFFSRKKMKNDKGKEIATRVTPHFQSKVLATRVS